MGESPKLCILHFPKYCSKKKKNKDAPAYVVYFTMKDTNELKHISIGEQFTQVKHLCNYRMF